MHFKSSSFYPFVTYKSFSFSSFVGSIGGLMILLAGISIISLIESAFDFLVHLKCKILAQSKVHQQNTEHLMKFKKTIKVNEDHVLHECIELFRDFATKSNIHGVPNIVKKEKKMLEKVFWAVTVSAIAAMCTITILNTINSRSLDSIELRIDDKVWNLNDVGVIFLL